MRLRSQQRAGYPTPSFSFMATLFRHLFLGAVAVCVSGCGSPPSIDKELDTVHSWTATAGLGAAERRDGAISQRYTARLADQARSARAEASTSLAAAAHDSHDRARASAALDSLDTAIRGLDSAAKR